MGLAERRGVKEFQDNHFPALKQAMDDAAGFTVELEVNWDSIATEDYAHMYNEAFKKVFFDSVTGAFQDICQDDMGREALKEGLKKVVFSNLTGMYGASAVKFEDGVLTVDHHPVTNIDDVEERKKAVVAALEKAL